MDIEESMRSYSPKSQEKNQLAAAHDLDSTARDSTDLHWNGDGVRTRISLSSKTGDITGVPTCFGDWYLPDRREHSPHMMILSGACQQIQYEKLRYRLYLHGQTVNS